MTAVELLTPAEARPDNSQWHQIRRTGVTAAEIAVVMGLSKWNSPFNLYWSKVNGWATEDSEIMSTGRHLEDAIADWWMADRDPLENLAATPAGLYAHPERPWQLATPDRLLYLACDNCDGRGGGWFAGCADCMAEGYKVDDFAALLECKWVAYSWDGWGKPDTDEVPVAYRCQTLWQADVMGVDEVQIAALGPGGFRSYIVRRDETDLELMRKAGEEFVRRLTAGEPPDLDSHTATIGALKRLHPEVGEGDVEVDAFLYGAYDQARRDRKDAEERLALCEASIRERLGSTYARAVHDGKPVASRSVFDQQRLDTKRLRAEQPEIAATYTTTTTVDKLTPGRTKS